MVVFGHVLFVDFQTMIGDSLVFLKEKIVTLFV